MQLYLGWLPILKDFNEGLSKEIAHRAHLEQEIIKFEVRIYFLFVGREVRIGKNCA